MENAYKGRFTDRFPNIRAAGILTKESDNSIEECLEIPEKTLRYFIETDYVCKPQDQPNQPEVCIKRGLQDTHNTEVWKMMKANEMSPYEHLANELAETVYASYWRAPLGRRQYLPCFCCFNPEELTHGINTEPKTCAGDLINPRKSHCQVLCESEIGKECYKISHGDYDPGEQVKRKYDVCCKNFNPCTRFGKSHPYFADGQQMHRVLKWADQNPVSYVSIRQADYVEKNRPELGKARASNPYQGRNASEGSTFGICLKKEVGVEEMLSSYPECSSKRNQLLSLKQINTVRNNLRKRGFSFSELLDSFYSISKDGHLPIETVDTICKKHHIYINKPIFKLLEDIGIMDNKQLVNVSKFADLLNWKKDFPQLPKAEEPKNANLDYATIHSLSMTGEKVDTTGIPPAGKPSLPVDVTYPRTVRDLKVDRGNLEGETDALALISPSIFTTYGLSHRDFFKPRSAHELQKIFCGIGVNLSSQEFNNIWEEGCLLDETGGVCIETFRNLLQKQAAKNFSTT